jgi:membrane protein
MTTRGRRAEALAFGRRFFREWSSDRVPDLAAEVAFYAILSLFPALLALASLLGVLDAVVGADVAERAQEEALSFLRTVLTSEADGTIEAATSLFTDARPGVLTFSLLAALWALARGFAALIRALGVVYDLDEGRSWFKVRGTALVLAVGSIVAATVMLALLVVGPLLGSGEQIADEVGLGDQFVFLWEVMRLPTAFVLLVLWAATIFHLAPAHRSPWRADLPGAVVTGVLWALFSASLRVYVQVAQDTNAVFGALGGVLIVLLWFWLLSLGVMIGGEVNQLLLDRTAPEETGPEETSEGVEGTPEGLYELAGVHGAPAVEQDAHDR